MAAEILTQPTNFHTEGFTSFAEFGVLYGEKGLKTWMWQKSLIAGGAKIDR